MSQCTDHGPSLCWAWSQVHYLDLVFVMDTLYAQVTHKQFKAETCWHLPSPALCWLFLKMCLAGSMNHFQVVYFDLAWSRTVWLSADADGDTTKSDAVMLASADITAWHPSYTSLFEVTASEHLHLSCCCFIVFVTDPTAPWQAGSAERSRCGWEVCACGKGS